MGFVAQFFAFLFCTWFIPIRYGPRGNRHIGDKRHVATVTFDSVGQRTKMTIHQTVSEEKAEETGAYQNWVKMFDKLNQLLQNPKR